ncbi:LysR substrate-binding domain-containing protein [Phyllobacterium sp. TAF24]|uniref:LysR substrate-binding domain-containing protein n=1 Tax=unclassified Phyllobacterium TaxID=2638441 RepID=UPI0008846C51|nr:LysR substrate-binding domain-containing protein [Phyllobacterium sp. OV277]SDN84305.1 LysR family transcriptional regulator, glycine cleavage system transcriptional activator [Phyllobacterium sp. OV277]
MSSLPLPAIRVFESVARLQNFTKAAEELNMTQSAVSYQVKLLEEFAGAPLFHRLARGVSLTDKGDLVAPVIRRALAELSETFRAIREEQNSVLLVSVIHTFASNWLTPRIVDFQTRFPDISVRFDIASRMVDFVAEGIDCGVRMGKGSWPGLKAHRLLSGGFTPLASPAYLEKYGRPQTPVDLLNYHLITPNDDWWPIWFRQAGVEGPLVMAKPGVGIDTQQIIANLALSGGGVALVSEGIFKDEIDSGRLVQLFDVCASTGSDFYLVYPEGRQLQPKTRLFRDWILEQAGVL